jgi:GTPase SAR1 family protein
MDLSLKTPFSMIICGPSMSGKTNWCHQLMLNQEKMYSQKPGKKFYCYNMSQPIFEKMTMVEEFKKGMPDRNWLEEISRSSVNSTVYIDDLALEATKDTVELFSVFCHHLELNVVFIQHTLFSSTNPSYRQISQNAGINVIFAQPRDKSSFAHLARQMDPVKWKTIIEIYKEATSRPYGYLYIDFHQSTPEELRFRTNVFDTPEKPITFYVLD